MKIGIVQGRLTPTDNGFHQDTPEEWIKEFAGVNHVEWIITRKSFDTNPFFTEDLRIYPISSVCCDHLVDRRIFTSSFLKDNLDPVCDAAIRNHVKSVTIPLLEESDLKDNELRGWFCKAIEKYPNKYPQLNFSFEAEMPASKLMDVVLLSDAFYVTYDTGNITYCGYNHDTYIRRVFDKINNVHLKDRRADGKSVLPGFGDTDFRRIFRELNKLGYNGPYTLQTARGEVGSERETIKAHSKHFRNLMQEVIDERNF